MALDDDLDDLDESDLDTLIPLEIEEPVFELTEPKKPKHKRLKLTELEETVELSLAPVPIFDYYKIIESPEELVPLIHDEPGKLTPMMRVFLTHYMASGTVSTALKKSGLSRKKFDEAMTGNKLFASAMKNATEAIVDMLEQEGMRRAMLGSDRLLKKMLESFRPERYRHTAVSVENNMNVTVNNWAELAQKAEIVELKPIEAELIEGEVKEDA